MIWVLENYLNDSMKTVKKPKWIWLLAVPKGEKGYLQVPKSLKVYFLIFYSSGFQTVGFDQLVGLKWVNAQHYF